MPTCSNCGRENSEGYRFCQGCGTPLVQRPPSREVAQVQACSACGNANGPGMRFCSNCGTPLATPPKGKPATVSCPSCGGTTPYGFSFCQQCGTPITDAKKAVGAPASASAPKAADPAAGRPAQVATVSDASLTPPAGMAPQIDPRVATAPAAELDPVAVPPCPPSRGVAPAPEAVLDAASRAAPGWPEPEPAAVAEQPANAEAAEDEQGGRDEVGAILPGGPVITAAHGAPNAPAAKEPAGAAAKPSSSSAVAVESLVAREAAAASAAAGGVTVGPGARRSVREEPPQRLVLARLVSVRRDGSDGEVHEITEEAVDLGRSEGQLTFPDDPYLSERHCRFAMQDGSWVVQDLDSRNGVYLRITETVELAAGDTMLLGKQVLRFDLLSDAERNLAPAVENGVAILGSPLRDPWGRLRQLTVAGVSRDVYYLYRPKVAIGREDGDLIFPDDEFMSRQHMALSLVGGKVLLKDVGSSNGTFVRIRDQPRLKNREMLRIGDQLLRFELA